MYEVYSRHYFITGKNETIKCLFIAAQGTLEGSFDYRLVVIPDLLQSVSLMMLYIGTVEFISAQVPYSMKGLMAGMTYFMILLSITAWSVIFIPFNLDLSAWGTGTISCGFWYILLLFFLLISVFLIMLVLKIRYKKRRREDLLPNEHFFAERYYSTNSWIPYHLLILKHYMYYDRIWEEGICKQLCITFKAACSSNSLQTILNHIDTLPEWALQLQVSEDYQILVMM